jgi:hypothetical protein
MRKVLTKDCPSCKDCTINDENKFQCSWGKSKKRKILEPALGRAKRCKLIKEKV